MLIVNCAVGVLNNITKFVDWATVPQTQYTSDLIYHYVCFFVLISWYSQRSWGIYNLIYHQPFKKSIISIIFLVVVLLLASSSILTISFATPPPIIPPVTHPPGTANNTLVYDLTSSENRTILPIQMMLPDGTWSGSVETIRLT